MDLIQGREYDKGTLKCVTALQTEAKFYFAQAQSRSLNYCNEVQFRADDISRHSKDVLFPLAMCINQVGLCKVQWQKVIPLDDVYNSALYGMLTMATNKYRLERYGATLSPNETHIPGQIGSDGRPLELFPVSVKQLPDYSEVVNRYINLLKRMKRLVSLKPLRQLDFDNARESPSQLVGSSLICETNNVAYVEAWCNREVPRDAYDFGGILDRNDDHLHCKDSVSGLYAFPNIWSICVTG